MIRWEIYSIIIEGFKTTIQLIDTNDWLSFSGTGNDKANLAIDAGFFADEERYRIRIYCDRSPDFTNFGMFLNDSIVSRLYMQTVELIPTKKNSMK